MKKVAILATASLAGLLAFAAMTLPVYAWQPQGTISKAVQNQTTGSEISEANDVATALTVAPGDTLVYTITVGNDGSADDSGNNDMPNTQLTDTLPDGLGLIGNTAQRTITANLGSIAPGETVIKTYTVKVTSNTDGQVITNKSCFSGGSKNKDHAEQGCDTAVVQVKVPVQVLPPTPGPTSTPVTQSPTSPQPIQTTLPTTGSTALSASIVVVVAAVAGFTVNTVRLRFRSGS